LTLQNILCSFPVVLLWNTFVCCNWRQHLQRLSPHGSHWPTVDEGLDNAALTSVSLILLGRRNATMIYYISSSCGSLKWQSQYVNKLLFFWICFRLYFSLRLLFFWIKKPFFTSMAKWNVIFIISWSTSYIQVQNIVAAMSQSSNCYKVHPDTDPGPCSHCCQEYISKRYVYLVQKKLDNIEFYDFVQKTCNISDCSCICRKCERK
jgi:hypothetical protein